MYLLREGSAKTLSPHFTVVSNDVSNENGTLMFFPEKSTGQWFYESGMAERNLINWVNDAFIRPDGVFLDIGAHVGTYSMVCGKKAKHTYSFECSPRTFCYLAANIALHGLEYNVTPISSALGDKNGIIEYIIRSEDGGGNGVKHLSDADTKLKKVSVDLRTLDSFGLTNITFIKIDVEGFEKEVLLGAKDTLKNSGYPPILFECWGEWKEAEGVPAIKLRESLFEYIKSIGYSIQQVSNALDTWLAVYN